jgi:hypothetical protein
MKKEFIKNNLNAFISRLNKSVCWLMIFSLLLITINTFQTEQNFLIPDSEKSVLFTTPNLVLSELNFNERNTRLKNVENLSYSLVNISSYLIKIDDYYNQSKIRNIFNSLSLLLTSAPNNHSLRSPPIICI